MRNRIFKFGLVVCVLLGLLATGVHAAQAATASVSTGGVAEVSGFALNQSEVYAVEGSAPLKVLLIGNSFSVDSTFYLGLLAKAAGQNIQVAYLHKDSATLRHHAKNLQQGNAEYSYYLSTTDTGKLECEGSASAGTGYTIRRALDEMDWDVVCLQQGVAQSGFSNTYNADLDYLVDYIRKVEPEAKLYWNLIWAGDEDTTNNWKDPDKEHAKNFRVYYNEDQKTMYNAIVDCFEEKILNSGKFDGWFPTGVAIQNLRANYSTSLTRDGYHLSHTAGRFTAAMTLLKTLYPDLDLNEINTNEAATILRSNTEVQPGEASIVATYLHLFRGAVEDATADLTKAPARLPGAKAQPRVESTGNGDFSLVTTQAPMKLHFPDITVLRNGTALVSAYENVAHTPTTTATNPSYAMQGAGRLLVWASKDDGTDGSFELKKEPLLVVDEKKLEEWGIVDLARTKEEREQDGFTFMADARDPNFGLVYTDITGDGMEDEVLLFTFWVRNFKETAYAGGGLYLLWGTVQEDGTIDWVEKPQPISGTKRGDIASFSDGTILIPTYSGTGLNGKITCREFKWEDGTWTQKAETVLPDNVQSEIPEPNANKWPDAQEHNECSFVAPDPDGKNVYAFVRESGEVLKSTDRGRSWDTVADEDGDPTISSKDVLESDVDSAVKVEDDLIQQPGFAIIDENRVFATWSKKPYPRGIWGKMFYVNEVDGWNKMGNMATSIYESQGEWPAGTSSKDTGDPSSKLMPNGDILVVHYDTAYRAIVGTWVPLAGVEVTQTGAGTVSVDKDKGLPGEKVTVTAVPANGGTLIELTVTKTVDGVPTPVALTSDYTSDYTFTIDDGDAEYTVWAQFVMEWDSFEHSGYFIDLKSSLGLTVYLNLPHDDKYTATARYNNEPEQELPLVWNNDLHIYEMTFEDIAAKEMRDTIAFAVYEDGEKRYELKTSVYDAAEWIYGENKSKAYRTMLADMVAYGTAAQENWGYNTGLLKDEPNLQGGSAKPGLWVPTTNVGASEVLNGKVAATLSLKDRIELNVYVNDVAAQLTSVTFNGEELDNIGQYVSPDVLNPNLACFKFDDLAVKDVKGVFELGIKLMDGRTGTVRYSIADYVLGVSDSSAQKPLFEALQKYVDSVIDYFVPQMDNITTDVDELRVYRIIGS